MKILKSSFLFILICTLFISACQEDEPIVPNETEYVVPTITPTGAENYLNMDSDYIFDQNKLHTFELKLPESSLARINNNPTAEEYVAGSLIFEGDTISPVGIRYKGSIGAFVNCVSNSNLGNPSGFKTCTKLSMKIKLNWTDSSDKFFKLKKLQFHSMNNDPTQLRERLGYSLFREMGVPTPRSVHARLIINGEYVGLFALVEQIDGRFTKYNFNDGDGNLYKEVWPLKMNGQPQSTQEYLAGLKTNEDDNPSVSRIQSFAQAVANAPDVASLKGIIASKMDLDKIMSYAVVDRTIRHDDGPFHWYCNSGDCSSHNFYWYEEPTEDKLYLIPWDLDHAFANIIFDANPVTPIADDWGEQSNNCQPFGYGLWQLPQRSAACDKLTGGWASFSTEYEQKRQEFKNGAFAAAQVNAKLDAWSAQIRDATIEANTAHEDAISIQEWENAVNALRSQLEFARN